MWQLKCPTWAPGDKRTRQFSWNFYVTVNVCHVNERVDYCYLILFLTPPPLPSNFFVGYEFFFFNLNLVLMKGARLTVLEAKAFVFTHRIVGAQKTAGQARQATCYQPNLPPSLGEFIPKVNEAQSTHKKIISGVLSLLHHNIYRLTHTALSLLRLNLHYSLKPLPFVSNWVSFLSWSSCSLIASTVLIKINNEVLCRITHRIHSPKSCFRAHWSIVYLNLRKTI